MRKLVWFATLTASTQAILLFNQLLLVPIQTRLWGVGPTAGWYSAIAFAALTTVADLGLRNAGHAELLRCVRDRGDSAALLAFRQIWGSTRFLLLFITIGLIALDAIGSVMAGHTVAVWRLGLIASAGLDTCLVIRISYLDSVGLYTRAEGGFVLFVGGRLVASLVALLAFGAGQTVLSAIFLASSVLAMVHQSRSCRPVEMLRLLAGPWEWPSRVALMMGRHTVAAPCATWMQLQLPVLVLSYIGMPSMVTIYVALRAVFGIGRQSVQQLARPASVEYLRLQSSGRGARAEIILSVLMIAAGCLGTGLACAVIVDNQRIVGMWLAARNAEFYRDAALALGVAGSFYSYQITLNLMMRTGEIADVAMRQYCYIGLSALAAAIGVMTRMPPLYLALATCAEVVVAVMFLTYRLRPFDVQASSSGRRALRAAVIGLVPVLSAALLVSPQLSAASIVVPGSALWMSGCILLASAAAPALLQLVVNGDLVGKLLPMLRQLPTVSLTASEPPPS